MKKKKLEWKEVDIPLPTMEQLEDLGYDMTSAAIMLDEIKKTFITPIRKWVAQSGKDKYEIRTNLSYLDLRNPPSSPRTYQLYKNEKPEDHPVDSIMTIFKKLSATKS